MLLPTVKTPPKADISDFTVLIHSRPKAGKSTFCSHANNALFLATEPGLNALEVYQTPITSWEDLLIVCGEIATGDHPFKTIIIDTIDLAYKMCSEYICRKHKVEHESELGFGKGWALTNGEFQRVLNKLAHMPYGLFLISHSQETQVETRTGNITRITPTLPDKARKIVLGLVDMILYFDMETVIDADGKPSPKRVIRTKPSIYYEAGDRTGRLPEVLDLDYGKFIEAFNSGIDTKKKKETHNK